MLKEFDSDYRTLVLLRVVRKLLLKTESYGIYRLEKILKDEKDKKRPLPAPIKIITPEVRRERIKETVKNKLSNKEVVLKDKSSSDFEKGELFASRPIVSDDVVVAETERLMPRRSPPGVKPIAPRRRMVDPGDDLPAHLRYLKPVRAEKRANMDLNVLNPFVNDPNVKVIECEGENESVYVSGMMGRKPTAVKLDKEKIKEIIDIFSREAKIPVTEGLFKVTVGNLQFTAMVSETVSSRFIIKKI